LISLKVKEDFEHYCELIGKDKKEFENFKNLITLISGMGVDFIRISILTAS